MPTLWSGSSYMTCCGKLVCTGCIHAPVYDNQGNEVEIQKCPFCRIPSPSTDEEITQRQKKRAEAGDPIALQNLGYYFRDGSYGYPQDCAKALELWHRAGELGHIGAHTNIGYTYDIGKGVEVDKKKAKHYYELAAVSGDEVARCNLGESEKIREYAHRSIRLESINCLGHLCSSKVPQFLLHVHSRRRPRSNLANQLVRRLMIWIDSLLTSISLMIA